MNILPMQPNCGLLNENMEVGFYTATKNRQNNTAWKMLRQRQCLLLHLRWMVTRQ